MLIYEIDSTPKPQKQTRFGSKIAYNPSKQDEESIRWQLMSKAPKKPLEEALSVQITFYMPIPKSASKSMKEKMINNTVYHAKRPDIDNLSYLVVNAMKNLIYVDDSQIVELTLKKQFSENPRTVIKILQL